MPTSDKEVIQAIKDKMTKEVLETTQSKSDIVKGSNACKRLKSSLKINGGFSSAFEYANGYFDKLKNRRMGSTKRQRLNYTDIREKEETKKEPELDIQEIDKLLDRLLGLTVAPVNDPHTVKQVGY